MHCGCGGIWEDLGTQRARAARGRPKPGGRLRRGGGGRRGRWRGGGGEKGAAARLTKLYWLFYMWWLSLFNCWLIVLHLLFIYVQVFIAFLQLCIDCFTICYWLSYHCLLPFYNAWLICFHLCIDCVYNLLLTVVKLVIILLYNCLVFKYFYLLAYNCSLTFYNLALLVL